MIKHYEGIVNKAPYQKQKKAVFIDHFLKPVLETVKDEIDIYGPIIRLQVLTTPSIYALESIIIFKTNILNIFFQLEIQRHFTDLTINLIVTSSNQQNLEKLKVQFLK